MTIFVNNASMRWWLWPILKANFEEIQAACHYGRIFWTAIVFKSEYDQIPEEIIYLMREPWIKILVCEPRSGMDAVNDKDNHGVDSIRGADGFVWRTSDDNIFPLDYLKVFSDALIAQPEKKVFVCSHKRGNRTAFHGHDDLIAEPVRMYPCFVSGEQFLIHNSLSDEFRYDAKGNGVDGILIQKLHNQRPGDFVFLPKYFVPFDALKPERWDFDSMAALVKCPRTIALYRERLDKSLQINDRKAA